MLDRVRCLMRRVWRNLKQSPVLCTAAIGTVAVALTIIAFFGIVVLNVQQVTRQWSQDIQVTAYLEQSPGASQIQAWTAKIKAMPEVEKVVFVSRDEAFRRFQKRLGPDAELLEGFGPEILPAAMEITLKPPYRNQAGVGELVGRLRQDANFSDLTYEQEWLTRFDAFIGLLKLGGVIFGGFLLFAALFIVANTIKLTLYARRDEIEIMGLVGGSSMYIKTPFLLEGALQGLVGGLLAVAGAFGLFQWLLKEGLAGFLLISGIGHILFLSLPQQLLLVAAGTALGLLGSAASLRKFVRI